MRVFVYAWEGIYQGLHGIEDMCVFDVSNDLKEAIQEVDEWGDSASIELIYSYGLEDQYLDEDNPESTIEDAYAFENRGWLAFKIKDDVTLSTKELDHLCCSLGEESFIEEYCDINLLDIQI